MTNPASEQLTFTPGDDRWKQLRERALNDLFWFSSIVLGYPNVFPMRAETHLLFCRFLERRTGIPDIDSAPIQKCETPRGTGKTSLGTVGAAIQLACQNPNISIMIANERQETADGFLRSIKVQFETNDLLRALFPEVIPPDFGETTWATSKAMLRRTSRRPEPTFFTIGVGGTVTGTHPDVIIVDDPISKEAMENARVGAWQIMERVNRWCNELKLLLNPQATPAPYIRYNGTRWWRDDTYDYIEKQYGYGETPRRYRLSAKLPDGSTVSREVYRVGDMAVYRAAALENGIPVYPLIYSAERLAKLQYDDPELFACNLMNNPTDAAVRTFQDDWLRYFRWMDPQLVGFLGDEGKMHFVRLEDLSKIMIVDPAFTASGKGARAAIIVVGSDLQTGKRLLLEAKAQRVDPKDLVDDILSIAQRLRVGRVFIESVAQQAGFIAYVQSSALRRNLPLAIETVTPGGRNKDVRIEGLAAYFKAGAILIERSQLDLIQEYRAYTPGARYKDLLDALAYAPERWPVVGRPGPNPADRKTAELQDYYARRGYPQQVTAPLDRTAW